MSDYAKPIPWKNSCCHNSVLTSHKAYVNLSKEMDLILNHSHDINKKPSQFSIFSSGRLDKSSKTKHTDQLIGKEGEQDS